MKKKQNLISIFFILLIVGSIVAIAINPNNISEITHAMVNIKRGFVAMAFFIVGLTWLCEALVLYVLSRRRVAIMSSIKVVLAGQFFNAVTPFATGGQPAQLYMLYKDGMKLSSAASVLARKFLVYQSVLVGMSVLVVTFFSDFFIEKINKFVLVGFLGFALNFFVIFMLYMITYKYKFTRKIVMSLAVFLRKIFKGKESRKKLHNMVEGVKTFNQNVNSTSVRSEYSLSILLTVVQLTLFFVVPVIIGMGLGVRLGLNDAILMIAASTFVTMVTSFIPLPGAAVGAESSFYMFFSIFFPENLVLTTLILWRFCTFYMPLGVGGLVVLFTNPVRVRCIDKSV